MKLFELHSLKKNDFGALKIRQFVLQSISLCVISVVKMDNYAQRPKPSFCSRL